MSGIIISWPSIASNRFMTVSLDFSRKAALVMGIFLPLLETIRRWHQMSDWHYFLAWFDDYLLGGFLLFAAWMAHKNMASGQKFLAAGWGAATAGLFLSFIGQLDRLTQPDPAPVSSIWVAAIKGMLMAFCIVNLTVSLQAQPDKGNNN
jgi:hypothetical protein